MLKISGEVIGENLPALCKEIKEVHKKGFQIAIVVGGGNFWRYRDNKNIKISRVASDTIGLMATIMNARLLKEALMSLGLKAQALAPHCDGYFVDSYSPAKAIEFLSRKEIVICGGGTGNPFFTTDTAAALRALELECDVFMKATKVDGVYDKDPVKNKSAKFFAKLTYDEVLKRNLEIMDLTAITVCKENKLPVHVFNLQKAGNLLKAVRVKKIGTIIS